MSGATGGEHEPSTARLVTWQDQSLKRASAHASTTPLFCSVPIVAHLPSLTKVSLCHVELIFLRAVSLSGASAAFWKFAMQNGVSTLTTAAFASLRANCCAVLAVT